MGDAHVLAALQGVNRDDCALRELLVHQSTLQFPHLIHTPTTFKRIRIGLLMMFSPTISRLAVKAFEHIHK